MKPLIVVFLKWPQPGRVKTRLAAAVGNQRAVTIYRALVREVGSILAACPDEDIAICYAPAAESEGIRQWVSAVAFAGRSVQHWWPQPETDLGGRQAWAVERAFAEGYQRVALLGTDCIDVDPPLFQETWDRLATVDWVFGPATDGGYYLAATKPGAPSPRMVFQGVRWSSEHTLRDCLDRLKAEQGEAAILKTLGDIDEYEDWHSIRERLEDRAMDVASWNAPLVFNPVYKEKVWGGRRLETVYGRELPGAGDFGESWELVDREDEQVTVQSGPAAGLTLQELWRDHRDVVFGPAYVSHPASRFPLLVKILDAREDLSIQVHPPASVAAAMGGEPKTEMWYIAHAEPGAKIYAGLREGVRREEFEAAVADRRTQDQVHVLWPRKGEFIFIPSGRLHAIGAGVLIYEIQQNSDTTYRVFDWNRLGSDGKPRDLHVKDSLQCIDFHDIEPAIGEPQGESLVECAHFHVRRREVPAGQAVPCAPDNAFAVVTVLNGTVRCGERSFQAGDFFLVPARAAESVRNVTAEGGDAAAVLLTWLPLAG